LSYLVIAALFALPLAWLLVPGHWTRMRRNMILRRPFPDAWREILRHRVPYFRRLPADLQLQLKKHIQVFLAEKTFVGCAGVEITDEIRVTIAAQACLLVLRRDGDLYPALRRILVYPGAFAVERDQTDAIGLVSRERRELAGESWGDGQVILSWRDTVHGARDTGDGYNVVIHEFAHQLDQEKGYANGAPALGSAGRHANWAEVFNGEYERLQRQALVDEDALFDHYGATDPAEFFAVASEVFFERAQDLAELHPRLYRQLRDFYRLDPAGW
jgi:Mlc titration factor MtfA (ptsG expression regulator)